MKSLSKLLSALLVCGLVLVPACGDDDEGGLSVDTGTALSALTETEVEEICVYVGKLMAGALSMEQLCKQVSISILAFGDKAACDAAYQSCMNPESGQGGTTEYDCSLQAGMTECTDVTVQDALDCFDGMIAQQKQLASAFTGLSCDSSAEDLAALENLGETEEPAACTKVYDGCPAMGE